MNVLLLGGTQFIGRHIALELLRGGHSVAMLNRGLTPDALPAAVERLRGDRDEGARGLEALGERRWDACVDLSGYTAVQVGASVERLAGRVGRYLFVSAVASYRIPAVGPLGEDAEQVDPAPADVTELAGDMYGRLKVTCERIVRARFGERATVFRPQIVVGPHDPTRRLSCWQDAARQPGTLLAPGDGSDPLQVVDVRDIARFTLGVLESDVSGVFNLSGERVAWRDFVALLAPSDVAWVPEAELKARVGDSDQLALYRAAGSLKSALMHIDNTRAVRAGFTVSPLRSSLAR